VLHWHSDKLFARSDSFVACAAERMLIVADFASSCSRRSDQLVRVPQPAWSRLGFTDRPGASRRTGLFDLDQLFAGCAA
jgi:hypothetical protein